MVVGGWNDELTLDWREAHAGEELVFERSLGRPRNAVVLPSGWYCTFSAAPATVSQLPDGRVRLDYWDDRPEAVDVLLKARRRISGESQQPPPGP